MKEVELECFFCDANEIEGGVEVDDNDAIMYEMKNDTLHSRLYGALPGWSAPCAQDNWNPTVNRNKGEPLFQHVDNQ